MNTGILLAMMNHRLLLLPLVILTLPVTARPWTNTEGKTIEADFVSADEQAVRLRVKGRVTSYPLEKLSQADRDWIAAQSAESADDAGPVNPVYASDMEAFIKEIDKTYPFFELKGIKDDWEKARAGLLAEASAAPSDAALPRRGQPRHSRPARRPHADHRVRDPARAQPSRSIVPGISFIPGEGDTVMVLHPPSDLRDELPTGTVVTKINDKGAREYLDGEADDVMEGAAAGSPVPSGRASSPIGFRSGEGRRRAHDPLPGPGPREEVQAQPAPGRPAAGRTATTCRQDLKQSGRSVFHAKLDGGAGYLYLRRVDSSVVPGIDEALSAHARRQGLDRRPSRQQRRRIRRQP